MAERNYTTFSEPETDQVYVSGLPDGTTEEDIAQHFGSIGMIKEDRQKGKLKIWLYRDKMTGEMKGDGTVSYVDPFSAASAVEWFHQKEFRGAIISVSLALKGGAAPPPPRNQDRAPMQNRNFMPPPFEERPMPRSIPPPSMAVNMGPPRPVSIPGPPNSPFPPGPPAAPFQAGMENNFEASNGPAHGSNGPAHGGPVAGPPPPKELREGDWLCPGCGNTNFAFRGKCNRCQTSKPGASHGGGRGRGRGRGGGRGGDDSGRGRGFQAAPQGPKGLFSEGDWACPGCGNVNWARRPTCNQCNTPKPGTVDTNREGLGGGFKELDEVENAEAKRRRLENEEKNMYDEFGRLKKKFRTGHDRKAREAAALARLRGDPLPDDGDEGTEGKDKKASGQQDGSDKHRDRDRSSRDHRKDDKDSRDRDHERRRERDRDRQDDREGRSRRR